MPTSPDFPYPRRYNSLRLLGFDYSSLDALWFITLNTEKSLPLFGDVKLAKLILGALLNQRTLSRLHVCAFTLLPDHFHLLAGIRRTEKSLSVSLAAFKSYTTQVFWKRAHEIIQEWKVDLPAREFKKGVKEELRVLIRSLTTWQASIRPEVVEIQHWPNVKPEHFLGKTLWHGGFHEHIIRNEMDLRETLEYIALNPVNRGYVSQPQFYPFTSFIKMCSNQNLI
jgi:REP element-mobilizing transposase RayT